VGTRRGPLTKLKNKYFPLNLLKRKTRTEPRPPTRVRLGLPACNSEIADEPLRPKCRPRIRSRPRHSQRRTRQNRFVHARTRESQNRTPVGQALSPRRNCAGPWQMLSNSASCPGANRPARPDRLQTRTPERVPESAPQPRAPQPARAVPQRTRSRAELRSAVRAYPPVC
jgi:hypothetical protein